METLVPRRYLSRRDSSLDWLFLPPEQRKSSINKQIMAKRDGVYFLEARPDQCRYIEGKWDNVLFAVCCGRKVAIGHSWCDDHKKLVYTKSQANRRG